MDDRGLTRWTIDYIQHNGLLHVDKLFIYGIYDPAPLQEQLLKVLIRKIPKIPKKGVKIRIQAAVRSTQNA